MWNADVKMNKFCQHFFTRKITIRLIEDALHIRSKSKVRFSENFENDEKFENESSVWKNLRTTILHNDNDEELLALF